MKIVCVAVAGVVGWGVCAQERSWIDRYSEESTLAKRYCDSKELANCRSHLTTLLQLLDGRADIIYRLAKLEASSGDPKAALQWLATYSKTGLSIADPRSDAAFAGVRDRPEFAEIMARLDAARRPVSNSRFVVTIPEKDLLAEDLAYDPVTGNFFVSSVRHRKIVRVSRDRTVTDFVREDSPGIWAMLAVRVD